MARLGFSPETIKKALQKGLISSDELEGLAISEREMMARHKARFSLEISWIVEDTFEIFDEKDILSLLKKHSGFEASFEIDYQEVARLSSLQKEPGDSFLQITAEGFIWAKTLDLVGEDVSASKAAEILKAKGGPYAFERAFELGLLENIDFSVERVSSAVPLQKSA